MPPENAGLLVGEPARDDAETGFDRWFKVVPVDSAELLEQAYRLRYQVYCVENPFEDPAENPGGLEVDEYDTHAVHSLLVHRPTETVSGAVRLILPKPDRPFDSLPIQRLCAAEDLRRAGPFDLTRCAEISRFAVSKTFRRRLGEGRYVDTNWDTAADAAAVEQEQRRQLPYITLGLFRACLMMSIDHDVTHLFAVMEPALIRLIRRFGMVFQPIGPLVHYHGERQPCVAVIKDLIKASAAHHEDCWKVGTDYGRLRLD